MTALTKNLGRTLVKTVPVRCIHLTLPLKEEQQTPRNRAKCTLIPGDGVGPELLEKVEQVFKAIDVPIDFECYPLSEVNPVPNIKFEDVKHSIKMNKVCIKGTLDRSDIGPKDLRDTLNMRLRTELDLFANVVHVRSLPGIKARHKKVDTVIIRENTEGEYSALEHESVPGVVECLKIITADRSKRIAKFAFDYATKNNRKKVTAVHKANIMKLGDGLFLSSCEQIAQLYPRIKLEKMIVDNTTMQMVSNPNQFDVMVTPNLYGNIVNNLAAGLVGGAGVVPGASYSSDTVVFEPGAHHTFAGGVGKNVANPTAMLLCSVKLLQHFNMREQAKTISDAIHKVLKEGKVKTKDVGGTSSTDDFVKAILSKLSC